jgi:hypothetical protein
MTNLARIIRRLHLAAEAGGAEYEYETRVYARYRRRYSPKPDQLDAASWRARATRATHSGASRSWRGSLDPKGVDR